ncbi:30530_t:CDS:1, partial [Racocetra persica]
KSTAEQETSDIFRQQIEDLIKENEELKTKNKKLSELKKINNVQNLLLRDAIDKTEFYKARNFQEFDAFIYNYIFELFDW